MDSESPEYFKITIPATDDDDDGMAELEVTHSPDEDENGPENGIGLALTIPGERKRFESVHLTPGAAVKLRDALSAALAYRETLAAQAKEADDNQP